MKDIEYVNAIMDLGSKKLKEVVHKIYKDAQVESTVVNDGELLELAEKIANKEGKLTGNQTRVLAKAIFVHKSAYYKEYKKAIEVEAKDLDERMRTFIELILK